MKFSAKKLISLVFAAGLAAATLNPLPTLARPGEGLDRSVSMESLDATKAVIRIEGAMPGQPNLAWAAEVRIYGYDEQCARLAPPVVNTGRPGRYYLSSLGRSYRGSHKRLLAGASGEAMKAEVHLNDLPFVGESPIYVTAALRTYTTYGPWEAVSTNGLENLFDIFPHRERDTLRRYYRSIRTQDGIIFVEDTV